MTRPRSRRGRLLGLYLGLLALSHLVRWVTPADRSLPPRVAALSMAAVDEDQRRPPEVRLAYYEWENAVRPEVVRPDAARPDAARPTLLLLHGSPGSGSVFDGLAPLLDGYRVIAPDLPGFGHSSHKVPDYSIRAHAIYVRDLLDRLAIEQAHVVGFSMGGGVALHLAELEPSKVRSIILLSAIGVQELELLGQYHLNHALHGFQLAGLWLISEAVPHFGLLDGFFFGLPYARNFYDTDQRPLRGMLERFEPPMQIIHGRGDILVPFAAAEEHHRLVPQSELVVEDSDHFMTFQTPEILAPPILDFVGRVDSGDALSRAQASEDRRLAAAGPPQGLPAITGFNLVIVMMLIAVATLVSEDLTCIAAGLLVARGTLDFWPAALACGIGIFFGDLALYGLGRLGQTWLASPWLSRWIPPQEIAKSRRWFERRGSWVILLSRFLPGTRLPTYVAAGLLNTNFWWFAGNLLIPVALWTPLLVAISQVVGDRLFRSFALFERYALIGFVVVLAVIWFLVAIGRQLVTWRGRRLLLGTFRRTTQWEFWPSWAIYPPVVVYILGQALRHRSATLFTAANPGLPAGGGFAGESKSTILDKLDPEWRPRFRSLAAELSVADKIAGVERFLDDEELDYPIVLKPDWGQRGIGVAVVRSREEAELYLRGDPASSALGGPLPDRELIVQEYVGGPELGIFYARFPGAPNGRILSITEKIFPHVVGDGQATLERLILADQRAVIQAPVYLRRHAKDLERVPALGEVVQLVDVGSHSGGTICVDGGNYRTDALAAALDRLSHDFGGFYLGRVDFRASSIQAFEEGRGLKVLEINGVTSEPTHIYDPSVRRIDAYRALFEGWRLAFEIGAANRARGVRPLGLAGFLELLWNYRGQQAATRG